MPRRHLAVIQDAPPGADSPSAVVVDLNVRRKMPRKTISIKEMKRDAKREQRESAPAPAAEDEGVWEQTLPKRRSGCLQGAEAERPCPYVSCKHHLYLDVNEVTGSIRFNFPDMEVWEIGETCVLDIADRGGETLESIGELLGLTRERVRQIEGKAMRLARRRCDEDTVTSIRELLAAADQSPDYATRVTGAAPPAPVVQRPHGQPPAAASDVAALPAPLNPRTWKKNT